MTTVLTVLMCCATLITLAVLLRPQPQPAPPALPVPPTTPGILDERLLDYVIVTLKSGATFGGVLYAEDDGAVVLAKAEHLNADGTRTSADGEIVVLRADVDFIQRP